MFSTQVLPTKREIMKMSEKELIEKLRKIYHKLEPELKQSDPQLLAKHIAGVFQRAEPKFDFQRAEPGGWGGKTLIQIIMALLALIAAEGGTTPSGNICLGETCPIILTVQQPPSICLGRCPPSGTPSGTPSDHDPTSPDSPPSSTPSNMPSSSDSPPSSTPSNMPSSSNNVSIIGDQKPEISDELFQARQRLERQVRRQLEEDRSVPSQLVHTYLFSDKVSKQDIMDYHLKEQGIYTDLLKGLFGKDKFRNHAYPLVKIIPLTEVTLDSLRINPEFLAGIEHNQPVLNIIKKTVIQLSDQLGGVTQNERKEIMKRATNYVKQKTKTFLLDLPFFSYDENTKDGKVTKDQLLEKMRGVIGKHMKDILKDSAQGDVRQIAALYLAINSQEILMKLQEDGPETTKAKGLQYTNPTIEESKKVLQHWLFLDFPNNNNQLINDLGRDNYLNRCGDIFEMADNIRGLLDITSQYLLDEYGFLQRERQGATFNKGRTAQDKDNEPKPGLLEELMEKLQKLITNVMQGASIFITGGLMTLLGVIYCAIQAKCNNNNRLRDRPERRRADRLRLEDSLRRQIDRFQLEDRSEDRLIPYQTPQRGQGQSSRGQSSRRKSTRGKTPKRDPKQRTSIRI